MVFMRLARASDTSPLIWSISRLAAHPKLDLNDRRLPGISGKLQMRAFSSARSGGAFYTKFHSLKTSKRIWKLQRCSFSSTTRDSTASNPETLEQAPRPLKFYSSPITLGAKTIHARFNSETWIRQDESNPQWRRTIEAYWKKPPPPEQGIVTVEATEDIIPDLFPDLHVTTERQLMYERIYQLRQSVIGAHRPIVRGVVMIGQPGIGKSSSIPYFMIRELAAGRPLYISTDNGDIFFVAKEGVWRSHIVKLFYSDDFPVPRSERLMFFIDSSQMLVPPHPLVQRAGFSVFCPSPALSRYKEMLKQGHVLLVMNPWRWEELKRYAYSMFPQLHEFEPAAAQEIFRDAQAFCPPTPRALAAYLQDVIAQNNHFNRHSNPVAVEMNSAVLAINDATQLSRLLLTATEQGYSPEVTHKLLCIHRTEPSHLPNLTRDASHVSLASRYEPSHLPNLTPDASHVSFASRYAESLMVERLTMLQLEGLHNSYQAWSRSSNGGDIPFEFLFLRALCDHRKYQYVKFGNLCGTEMRSKEVKEVKKGGNVTIVEKSRSFSAIVRGVEAKPADNLRNPPDWRRVYTPKIFESYQDVMPTPGALWIPSAKNNALFDAVVVEKGEGQCDATVWFIQLTVTQKHTGSRAGYELVTSIHNQVRDQIQTSHPNAKVDMAWLLIVPYKRREKYSWKFESVERLALERMPEEGRVFAQAFDSKENFA